MLRGHATAKTDDKGRVKIPSEFLDPFLSLCGEERRVFVTSRDGEMVLVYPLPVWEAHERRLAELPSTEPAVESYLRTVNFWGREAVIDAAGRVLVHPLLRERAGVTGELSVFGKQNLLEICPYEHFRVRPPTVSRDDLSRLAQYGV